MADVGLIISSMHTIATSQYRSVNGGPAPSRKTGRELEFDRVTGSAATLERFFTENPRPNRDQRENAVAQFNMIHEGLKSYCVKGSGTEGLLKSYNDAHVEWELLCRELGG